MEEYKKSMEQIQSDYNIACAKMGDLHCNLRKLKDEENRILSECEKIHAELKDILKRADFVQNQMKSLEKQAQEDQLVERIPHLNE